MSIFRKAFWPGAIALSLLLFIGLTGKATTVSAQVGDPGDFCGAFAGATQVGLFQDIDGHTLVSTESEFAVWGQLLIGDDSDEDDDGDREDEHAYTAEVSGSADVHIIMELDGTTTSDLEPVGPTHEVNDMDSYDPGSFSTGLKDELAEFFFKFSEKGTINSKDGGGVVADDDEEDLCADEVCNTDDTPGEEGDEPCNDDEVVLVILRCDEDGEGEFTVSFVDEDEDDDSVSIDIECRGPEDSATIDANPASIEIIPAPANVSHSFIRLILLDQEGDPAFPGQEVLFTVDRCAIEEDAVDKEGDDDAPFTIDGTNGDANWSGGNWEGAETIFRTRLNPNNPSVAAFAEQSDFAFLEPDSTRQEDQSATFSVVSDSGTERTVAGAIVHCEPGHNGSTAPTPGVITVTAIVQQFDAADDIFTTKITLVGPPATITVNASPTEVRCGEKSSIVVVVKDAIGQNVSDHTQIEAVTNAGGVLGGTGAVIGLAGPVVPVSSTVAELFGGTTTFFLLTSEQHSGPYEVVVTTGGANFTAGGGIFGNSNGFDNEDIDTFGVVHSPATASGLGGLFSTPPISVQTTVRCTIPVAAAAPAAPAPAPTITAPRTGDLGTTAIRPPSTGDAGLASSGSQTSWLLVSIASAVGIVLMGAVTYGLKRR